jgi:hypothetical protein
MVLKGEFYIKIMVWIKNDYTSFHNPRDSKIVRSDFIITEGNAISFSFLDKEEKGNIFGRDIYAPLLQIMKVHRNHPVKITSSSMSFPIIYPISGINQSKKNFRMPAEIYKDRMDYDVCSFMQIPYEPAEISEKWKKYTVLDGFTFEDNTKKNSYLLYLEHGLDIDPNHTYIVSEVMPSQVLQHLWQWFCRIEEITSHENTFSKKLEGKIIISRDEKFKLMGQIKPTLENRFKTHLDFQRGSSQRF